MRRILFIGIVLSLLLLTGCNKLKCEGAVKGDPELYYYKVYKSNLSGDNRYECIIKNNTLNEINKNNLKIQQERARVDSAERKVCYEDGRDYNISFDLIRDYDLSCEKIKYINDNFILSSERKDGGSVSGSYNGFLSSGHIKGQYYDWVNTENLATGLLIKQTSYHLDCESNTLFWKYQFICDDGKAFPEEVSSCWNGVSKRRDTRIINYYSEKDFVMYYVDNCIMEEEK